MGPALDCLAFAVWPVPNCFPGTEQGVRGLLFQLQENEPQYACRLASTGHSLHRQVQEVSTTFSAIVAINISNFKTSILFNKSKHLRCAYAFYLQRSWFHRAWAGAQLSGHRDGLHDFAVRLIVKHNVIPPLSFRSVSGDS